MYRYNICTQPDRALFQRQCAALERHVPNLRKGRLLEDVDGSLIQLYETDGAEVKVLNDECVGALYVESEIDLLPFFRN